ncbi:MAG: hypothetical protein JWN61_1852 [Pseudonocardiales bacterium]|nr:hypothetical protein [Jatrophihabitantaceae bacterium]MCW2603717.1 hypothetical protein [Pseudonocardiales bacterium]
MATPRILLIHGAAVTSAIWAPVLALLADYDVLAVDRPCLGDMALETEWLAPYAEGAFVVGVSGGATLGLSLASSPVALAGALLHEPAVGSLAPGLLDPIAAAYAADGVAGFGRALYGPRWSIDMAPPGPSRMDRELPMFRSFEPAPPRVGQGLMIVSVGEDSPPIRYASVAALHERFGIATGIVPGSGHFAPQDAPRAFAALIRSTLAAA